MGREKGQEVMRPISGHLGTESPKEGAPSEQGTTREPGQGQKNSQGCGCEEGHGTGQSWKGTGRTWESGAHLPPVLCRSPLCSACCSQQPAPSPSSQARGVGERLSPSKHLIPTLFFYKKK